MPSIQEHDNAIQALIADPTSSSAAREVMRLGVEEPDKAELARSQVAPQPALPLDLVRRPYNRHNLHMPDRPATIVSPSDLGELEKAMQKAATAWRHMKAIGDGWGFANTGFTRGTLIPTVKELDRILPVDESTLKSGVDANRLLKFEGGATIEDLNDHLEPRGKALLNQPGFEDLTFVGTMASGGHGSGIWQGPLSSQVRALHVLNIGINRKVQHFQVETDDGISDKAAFDAANPDVELIQDDQLFYSSVCAMGTLGVIYAAVIEIQGDFRLKETRKKHKWSEIKARLPQLLDDQGTGKRLHSIEIWVNPYEVDGEVHAVLGEREWTTDPIGGHRGLGIEWGGVKAFFSLIQWWLEHHPQTIPTLIDSALDATQASNVVMKARKALNFGPPNAAPVVASAAGVPVVGIGNFIDSLCDHFQKELDQRNRIITSPVGVRFVRRAKAYMSPSYGRDTCMIEVPILQGTPHALDTLKGFHEFVYQGGKGRPHWGQVNHFTGAQLGPMFPKLNCFLESFRAVNGNGFFDNAFTEQFGLRLDRNLPPCAPD